MIRVDVHQHLWSAPLVAALRERCEVPFVRSENGLSVLYLAGERPYVIDTSAEAPARRADLVARDGLDSALLCLSSPLGVESLPCDDAEPLLDAYHEGALALGPPFGVWGAIALDRPDPADVDRALALGCAGVCLPAASLASVTALARLHEVLDRVQARDAPLLVHPGGQAGTTPLAQASLLDPLWWPTMTSYLAQMQAAWLAFVAAGRATYPRLRVVFAALAGLAPLHAERLRARGGPVSWIDDPLLFYETSSYGQTTVHALEALVGPEQILYGSDRPMVEPADLDMPHEVHWDACGEGTLRAFAGNLIGAPS